MTGEAKVQFLERYKMAADDMRWIIANSRDERHIEHAEARVSRLMIEAEKAGITPEELRGAAQ